MKKMFVWQYVGELTDHYHDEGGALVIADTLEFARKLLAEAGAKSACEVFTQEPDFTASVESSEDRVFIFPDAGCC